MSDLPKRKNVRLKDYDYGTIGGYFITICVKNRRNLLGKPVGSRISGEPVGRAVHVAPCVQLSKYGRTVDKHIKIINSLNKNVIVDKYIIMPNHIHLIILLDSVSGATNTARPTIPKLMRTFKSVVSKEVGFSLWQTSYYDRIIRDYDEYCEIWKYIDENPFKWAEDEYYSD